MKKMIFIAVLAFVASISTVSFARTKLSISGGFNTVSMKDHNDLFDELAVNLAADGLDVSFDELKTGISIAGEVTCVKENLEFGIRSGYLKTNSKLEATTTGVSMTIESSASLIPVLGGGRYSYELSDKLNLTGSLFAGVGFARFVLAFKQESSGDPSVDASVPFTGSGFVSEILAGADYTVNPKISVFGNLGYRIASIAKMEATKDSSDLDIKKDDTLQDDNAEDLKIDFSGIIIEAGVKFAF